MVVLTPPVILVSSFVTISRIIDINDTEFYNHFGSLFNEFKNNKGFLSSQYYSLFFIRRLTFIILQVFLNDYLIFQACFNTAFSLFFVIFLFCYRPYKEIIVFISIIAGEICNLLIFGITIGFLYEKYAKIIIEFESTIILLIVGAMGVQFLTSVYGLAIGLKALWKKIEKYNAISFLKTNKNN